MHSGAATAVTPSRLQAPVQSINRFRGMLPHHVAMFRRRSYSGCYRLLFVQSICICVDALGDTALPWRALTLSQRRPLLRTHWLALTSSPLSPPTAGAFRDTIQHVPQPGAMSVLHGASPSKAARVDNPTQCPLQRSLPGCRTSCAPRMLPAPNVTVW